MTLDGVPGFGCQDAREFFLIGLDEVCNLSKTLATLACRKCAPCGESGLRSSDSGIDLLRPATSDFTDGHATRRVFHRALRPASWLDPLAIDEASCKPSDWHGVFKRFSHTHFLS